MITNKLAHFEPNPTPKPLKRIRRDTGLSKHRLFISRPQFSLLGISDKPNTLFL